MMAILLCYSAAALVLLIGITIYELRMIAYRQDKQRHPHARRWRMRPVVFADVPTLALLKVHYRKLTNHQQTGEYALNVRGQEEMSSEALLEALQLLILRPNQKSMSITPLLSSPQTFTQLMYAYRIILSTPLHAARIGLRIPASHTSSITLSRIEHIGSFSQRTFSSAYGLAAFLLKYITCLLAAYAIYIAFAVSQAEPLVLLLISYGIYSLHAIWSYPRITLTDRIAYSLLAPTSLVHVLCLPALNIYNSLHRKVVNIHLARHRT